jgi:mannose-6-phosphate isomerase
MHSLICNVQKYSWGRRGSQSKAALFKGAQDGHFKIDENEPYAELWMGGYKKIN